MIVAAAASGCTTVLVSDEAATREATTMEREALVDAAAAVSEVKWPRPEEASFGERLTGVIDSGDRTTRQDAVDAYVAQLSLGKNRPDMLFADAARHIGAADALVDVADIAAVSMRPAMADVSILETAIGDLSETRDIYLASLKALEKDGDAVDDSDMSVLKSDFNEAIEAVGAAADRIADAIAHNRTETYAGPAAAENAQRAF